MTDTLALTDERWQAIIGNDAAYDGQFIYAVATTGIFCRPSCKSRPPARANVRLFRHAEEAVRARFRPCKRCKPGGLRLPDEEWVAMIAAYIDEHYAETMTLRNLAEMSHGSPYHLQRTFRRIRGETPADYTQRVRIERAKRQLAATDRAIADVGRSVGLRNAAYFITLFKKKTGHTPAGYRRLLQSGSKEVLSNERQS